ncbi:MAG: 50S ribosomal protein L21 [Candidatus Omnitrophota bacterium]|nr:MAG: 50S ribosomal protein L21 [Candidatus Omnitrophota bacterium]
MYAVIEVGAKQYLVRKGDIIEVEGHSYKINGKINLNEVLLISDKGSAEIGKPYLKGARVETEVLEHIRGKKEISFKYRRRKSSRWQKGHRQNLTRLKITGITAA